MNWQDMTIWKILLLLLKIWYTAKSGCDREKLPMPFRRDGAGARPTFYLRGKSLGLSHFFPSASRWPAISIDDAETCK
jgi:hypothetical protein